MLGGPSGHDPAPTMVQGYRVPRWEIRDGNPVGRRGSERIGNSCERSLVPTGLALSHSQDRCPCKPQLPALWEHMGFFLVLFKHV